MADFIDRKELLRAIQNFNFNICCARATGKYKTNIMQLKMFTDIQEQFLLIAEGIPKADTERHAHWIQDKDITELTLTCNCCGYSYIEAGPNCEERYDFCPSCGCKMDEVEK